MEITKKYLTKGQYVTNVTEKIAAFLHHTVSTNAMSAWRWWNSTKARVGTAHIIDRDGSIIECFDPNFWAWHLGVPGDDDYFEKYGLGIEIVSAGPLYFEEGEYRFYPLWPNKLRYTTIPEEEVYTFPKGKEWKGHQYWHKYTEDQIDAVVWLLGKYTIDFPKLKFENNLDKFYEYNPDVIKNGLPGLWSHSTVREDKSDIFPYPPLLKALKSLQMELNGPTEIPEVTITAKKSKSKSKASKAKS